MKYFLLLLPFLIGCTASIHVPEMSGDPIQITDVAGQAKASFFQEAPSSFKALLLAEISSGSQKQSLRYAVTKQENALQIEVFPTTSFYTLILFKSDGTSFSLQNVSEGTSSEGALTDSTLQDTFGISLTVDELSAALFGEYKRLSPTVEVYSRKDILQIKSPKENDPQFYAELSPDLQTLKKVLFLDKDEDVRVSVTYENFFENGHQPQKITLGIPAFDTTVKLTVKKISPQQ